MNTWHTTTKNIASKTLFPVNSSSKVLLQNGWLDMHPEDERPKHLNEKLIEKEFLPHRISHHNGVAVNHKNDNDYAYHQDNL